MSIMTKDGRWTLPEEEEQMLDQILLGKFF
jgi:hypothetical protein